MLRKAKNLLTQVTSENAQTGLQKALRLSVSFSNCSLLSDCVCVCVQSKVIIAVPKRTAQRLGADRPVRLSDVLLGGAEQENAGDARNSTGSPTDSQKRCDDNSPFLLHRNIAADVKSMAGASSVTVGKKRPSGEMTTAPAPAVPSASVHASTLVSVEEPKEKRARGYEAPTANSIASASRTPIASRLRGRAAAAGGKQ
jgi:hypothetical protein